MKCSDISTEEVLRFLAKHQGRWCTWHSEYRGPDSMPSVEVAMPAGAPPKLQLAKMRRLVKSGLVDGCICGCRGDFEITDKGLTMLGEPRRKPAIYTLRQRVPPR